MSASVLEITFASDDTPLRGRLTWPAGPPAPVIVMAHGFSGVIKQLEDFTRAFGEAGLATFAFDHPGFGRSGGFPRQEVDPQRQLRAYRDAISCARARPEVRGEAVGIWGSSLSGGHVLQTAALDRRVRAAVAQVPFISGGLLMRERRDGAMLRDLCTREREKRFAGAAPATIPVTSEARALCALPGSDAHAYFSRYAASGWINQVTLSSFELMAWHEPGFGVAHIAPTPLLMIVAEDDNLTPTAHALDAFAAAGEPKELLRIPGGHFAVYEGAEFERVAAASAAFFRRALDAR